MEGTLIPIEKYVLEIQLTCEHLSMAVNNNKILKVMVMESNKMKEASEQIVQLKATTEKWKVILRRPKLVIRERPLSSRVLQVESMPWTSLSICSRKGAKVIGDDLLDPFITPERPGSRAREEISARAVPVDAGMGMSSTDTLKSLKADMTLLKSTSEYKSVKFGGLGLRSIQACHVLIKPNIDGYRYGSIMDPLLMLDRIFGSDDVEVNCQFKTLESRVKLKITTGVETAANKVLHFKHPRIFHKGLASMTSEWNKLRLNKIADYKVWKAGGEGDRNHILYQVNLLHVTLSNDTIAYAFMMM